MSSQLCVYVGPYLHVENTTNEIDNHILEAYGDLVRDGWMENNPDSDSSVWIIDDCEGEFDRPCEFDRTGNTDPEVRIYEIDIASDRKRMAHLTKDLVKKVRKQFPGVSMNVRWGVLCSFS